MHFATSPGRYVARNGKSVDARTLSEWRKAFRGHKRDAHKGQELVTCAACIELRNKVGRGK